MNDILIYFIIICITLMIGTIYAIKFEIKLSTNLDTIEKDIPNAKNNNDLHNIEIKLSDIASKTASKYKYIRIENIKKDIKYRKLELTK